MLDMMILEVFSSINDFVFLNGIAASGSVFVSYQHRLLNTVTIILFHQPGIKMVSSLTNYCKFFLLKCNNEKQLSNCREDWIPS